MIELHVPEFEKITLHKGINLFTFSTSAQSEIFLQSIEEAFSKRKKSSKLFLQEEEREKEPKDYYYIKTGVGVHDQEVKLHEVLIEKVVYDFYHDENQMKMYYDFQCQYQMFLNQLEIIRPDYHVLFHSENFQEKQLLKQLEFDVVNNNGKASTNDCLKIYCDTKISMNEKSKELITVVSYPETEVGLVELSQFATYISTLSGYVIIVTNVVKYFLHAKVQVNIYNKYSTRVKFEDIVSEYQLFDPEITEMEVVQIIEYYISGNAHLISGKYEKLVKSCGIDEANVI